ncbi:MAG: hypothetical protein GXO40_00105 [Epsilonproteobacteria bacterium]|nr:hypothetical protein [Campylobacterota bacterium]
MKKIISLALVAGSLFGMSLEQRVSILEQQVAQLQQKLNMVNKSQQTLQSKLKVVNQSQQQLNKQIQQGVILRCDKLKLKDFSLKYHYGALINNYIFTYILQNNYKQPIKRVYAGVTFMDKDDTKLAQDYINKRVFIAPHASASVQTRYIIDNDSMAEYLKDMKKSQIKVKFKPYMIEFRDGRKIECN